MFSLYGICPIPLLLTIKKNSIDATYRACYLHSFSLLSLIFLYIQTDAYPNLTQQTAWYKGDIPGCPVVSLRSFSVKILGSLVSSCPPTTFQSASGKKSLGLLSICPIVLTLSDGIEESSGVLEWAAMKCRMGEYNQKTS